MPLKDRAAFACNVLPTKVVGYFRAHSRGLLSRARSWATFARTVVTTFARTVVTTFARTDARAPQC